MAFSYSIKRLLEILTGACELVGNYSGEVSGIASLAAAQAGDLSFLGNAKYRSMVEESQASVLLLPSDFSAPPKAGQLQIRVENPSFALALICRDIENSLQPRPAAGVHPTAYIHPTAEVSSEASIGPFCSIGEGARVEASVIEGHVSVGRFALIGEGSYLYPRVVIADYCEVGKRNRLLAGCILGADGYGYEFYEGQHQRVPQIGNVVTREDVDVGANTTIDRARFGSIQIGQGTKIDNQVQIAHNVVVGKHCLIVAQVGISGSTVIGDGVVVGGQAGIAGHLKIGSGAMIAGGAAVVRDLQPKEKVRGSPAEPMMLHNRIVVLQRKLPDLFKRFDKLEKSVDSRESEASTD
jgi:UDP-3-O-[3-hydroxymyristoyl] glucosamine N-acyltransferase